MESPQITRRQFLKYSAGAFAGLTIAGLSYKYLSSKGQRVKVCSDQMFKKVVVVGVDGMDPKITSTLMRDGDLPNLSALSESGAFSPLTTSNPPNSPVAWTSISTGSNPAKHNIFDFIRRDPTSYTPLLSLSKSSGGLTGTKYESYVSAPKFWELTSDAGIPTSIIRWPVTFPPDKVSGKLISGLGVPDVKGFLSGYTYYCEGGCGESDKASNKLVKLEGEGGVFKTQVFGPRTMKGQTPVETPADITFKVEEDEVVLEADGVSHRVLVGSWSPFVKVKFKVSLFKSVSGIFKVFVEGVKPLKLYACAVQIDPSDPLTPISHPSSFSSELVDEIGLYYTLGMPEETDGYVDERLSSEGFLAQIREIERSRKAAFDLLFDRFMNKDGGVFAFVFDSSDRVQHVFWEHKILGGESSQVQVSEPVRSYFREKDEFIGGLTSKLGDDTLLMLISDHGFTSFEKGVSLNTWLSDMGYLTLTKKITEEDDGSLFRYVDWSNTKAYSCGFNSVYVNLKGREGEGIVSDKAEVLDDLRRDLHSFKDDEYGGKVVNEAYLTSDVYSGPELNECQDLVLGFNPGYRMAWQTAIGGFTSEALVVNDKRWAGDHLVDPKFVPGVIFSNQSIENGNPSQMDVAPTILKALGLGVPDTMDGKSML